jgi:hypothetical protein
MLPVKPVTPCVPAQTSKTRSHLVYRPNQYIPVYPKPLQAFRTLCTSITYRAFRTCQNHSTCISQDQTIGPIFPTKLSKSSCEIIHHHLQVLIQPCQGYPYPRNNTLTVSVLPINTILTPCSPVETTRPSVPVLQEALFSLYTQNTLYTLYTLCTDQTSISLYTSDYLHIRMLYSKFQCARGT